MWIASILLALIGLLGVLVTWLALSGLGAHGESVNPAFYVLFYAQLAVSAAQFGSGLFLWQGRNWARVLAVSLCGVNLAGSVILLFSGGIGAIAGIAVNIGLIRLLTNGEVRDWCDTDSATGR